MKELVIDALSHEVSRPRSLLVKNRPYLDRKNLALQDLTTALTWVDLSGLESI